MAVLVLGAVGAYIGAGLGYASLGWAIGSTLGGMLGKKGSQTIHQSQSQSLIDLKVVGTDYGQCIPYVFGSVAVAGQVWWNTDRRPTTTSTTSSTGGGGGGKGGGGGGTTIETTTSTTTYDMDILFGLTNNVIVGIRKIWDNGTLVWTSAADATSESLLASASTALWDRLTVYTGAVSQLPDPTYEAAVGVGNAPAYRGRGSVFIQGLKLGQSGQLRNFVFEVVTGGFTVSDPYTAYNGVKIQFLQDPSKDPMAGVSCSGLFSGVDLTTPVYGTSGEQTFTAVSPHTVPVNVPAGGMAYSHFVSDDSATADASQTVINVQQFSGLQYHSQSYKANATQMKYTWSSSVLKNVSQNIISLKPAAGSSVAFLGGSNSSIQIESGVGPFVIGGYGIPSNAENVVLVVAFAFDKQSSAPLGIPWSFSNAGAYPEVLTAVYGGAGGGRLVQMGAPILENTEGTGGLKTMIWVFKPPKYNDSIYPSYPTIAQVVSALCLRAGLASNQFDVTALNTITKSVKSFAVTQVNATRTALENLMSAFFFEITVSDKIYFRPRGGTGAYGGSVTIPYIELGTIKSDGQDSDFPDPLALRQQSDLELPAQIALTYTNINNDYQSDTQYSDRLISTIATTTAAVTISLGMTPSEAKAVADTMILDQAASLISTEVRVLGNYCALEPTDTVLITDYDGSLYRVRFVKKTDSYPLLVFEAVIDDPSVMISQGITSVDYINSTVIVAAADTLMKLMDIPILQDVDDDAGFYVAVKGSSTPYPGSTVYRSIDNVEFSFSTVITESAIFGTCTTTLGDWTGGRVFDEKNSVTVNVGAGTLISVTKAAVLNSLATNAMLIGGELIQYCSAALVSAGVYKLSSLLRGGRGSEWAMTGHTASQRCVALRASGIRRILIANSEIGLDRYYKGVTLGRATTSVVAGELFVDNGVGLKPFSPFDLRASRDGSNNVTFTWQRRTRLSVRTIGPLGISTPLGESTEAYEVDIFSSAAYTTVLRTISVATATAPYSSANQTTDGLTPGNPVYARVYQMSSLVGRGYKLEGVA